MLQPLVTGSYSPPGPRAFPKRHITRQWEQDILQALRRRGVALGPVDIAGRFSGFTESWIEEEYPATSLKELMGMVYNDEDGQLFSSSHE